MVTLDWTWRTTFNLPEKVLLVVGRTEYSDKAWLLYKEMLVPGYYRMLGDPGIVGVAVRTNERSQVAWSTMAFTSYEALENLVDRQMEWLSNLAHDLDTGHQLRHTAYRTFNTRDLPPSWAYCEGTIANVMKASPLGADAFPELSERLGIQDGGPRA